jgi:hypothetical protein
MSAELKQRPRWEIDRTRDAFLGAEIRVAANAFSPTPWTGGNRLRLTPVRDLILADSSRAAGLPVFFEGRLRHFERQIGIVFVDLETLASPDRTTEGMVFFRGRTVVILRGPALVELAFPFQVERLPGDADNYSRDLRAPRAQFEFPFSLDGNEHDGRAPARTTNLPGAAQVATAVSDKLQFMRSSKRRLAPVDLPLRNAVDRAYGANSRRGSHADSSKGKAKR